MTQAQRGRRRLATAIVLGLAFVAQLILQLGPRFNKAGTEFESWGLWQWFIEDAAISFAYARNWADGAGLVAFAGGERQEGYSNPTWVALLAVWELLGVDGFWSAKIMALVLAAATIVLTWRIAVEVIDDEDSWAPLFAPMLLAFFPQFTIWNASGLENPLFSFLLAGGLWRTLVEARQGGFPWSSVWFLLLACSRPEAIMYAAWGGFVGMVLAFRGGWGVRNTALWLVTFFLPFSAYHAIRYDYFAWAFPNTYYAKLGDIEFKPFAWAGNRGWKQLRGWAWDTGTGWFLPVVLAGLIGLRGWRRWLVPLFVVTYAVLFTYPLTDELLDALQAAIVRVIEVDPLFTDLRDLPAPTWWNEARVWSLLAVSLVAPLFALGDRRSAGRILAWGMVLITAFFSVRASGDWMKSYRWFSFVAVPGAVLLTCGIEEVASLFQRVLGRTRAPGWSTPGWTVAVVIAVLTLPGWILHTAQFIGKPETGPFSVKRRAMYSDWVMDRLWVEDVAIRNLDVDMGAHMFWSPHEMVDMAGLIDVSMAHHEYSARKFVEEYVFKEKKPQVAHVHGSWANTSKIPTYTQWKTEYFEIPPFPTGGERGAHVGNHIRRDLLLTRSWAGTPGRTVSYARGITLKGFEVPSPEVSAGKSVYVEVAVQYEQLDVKEKFRVLMFLSDDAGHLQSMEIPVGHDWITPPDWKLDEVWVGKFAFTLDNALEPGTYDVGFVVVGEDGALVPLATRPDPSGRKKAPDVRVELPAGVRVGGDPDVPARFARGEVVFPGVVTIGPKNTGEAAADVDLRDALTKAEALDCAGAATSWRLARLHLPNAANWVATKRATFAEAEAACYAAVALQTEDLFEAAVALESARVWTWRSEPLWAAQATVGQQLYERGLAARDAARWAEAYKAFSHAVRANPSLSWARRYAEEARDARLGIAPLGSDDKPKIPAPKRPAPVRKAVSDAPADTDAPAPAAPEP